MRESASRPSPRRQPAPLPPAPSARRPLDVLVEIPTPLGLALWRALADAALWADAGPGAALFRAPGAEAWGTDDPDVGGALWSLSLVRRLPWRESAPELAAGAARIAEWAEQQGHKETAAQFAHLAARLEPGAAAYATTAGRLHRRLGDAVRAQLWLRRAVRLARTGGREIDFAIAHLAWGNLDHDAGRFLHAEHHFCKGYRAALRAGRRSLAGAAQHDLLGVKIHTQRFDEAWEHAWRAVEMYAAHHPRFPLLGHDIA
ncbi:MAG TPA: hypothetical protein VFQ45_21580, partial [Longimicrobium sp.]|nr:hypothetical protein [Longimicrobium sp.]